MADHNNPEIHQNPEYSASDLPKALDLVKINEHWAQVITVDPKFFLFHMLEDNKYLKISLDSLTLVKKINCLIDLLGHKYGEVVPQAIQAKIYIDKNHDPNYENARKDTRVFGFYVTESDKKLFNDTANWRGVKPDDFRNSEIN